MVYGAYVNDKELVKDVVKYVINNCNKPVHIDDFDEKPLEEIMDELSNHWNPIEFHSITKWPGAHDSSVCVDGDYVIGRQYGLRESEIGVTFDYKMFDMHIPYTFILLQTRKGFVLQTKG